MDEQSKSKPGSDGGNKVVTQLVQIKYLLAGILALVVIGRFEDWGTNALTVFVTIWLVWSLETAWFWLPGSVSRLASIRSRRRAAKAESEARLRRLMRELEEAEANAPK